MVCPGCKRRFSNRKNTSCPYCGLAAVSGVVKTSTILISSGGTDAVFRSVEDVPDPLKMQLLRSTNGINAATIVIADKRGRKEIARAIRNLPGSAPEPAPAEPACPAGFQLHGAGLHWAGVALLAASGLVIWLVFK